MITPRRVVTFIRAVVALATIGVLAVGVPMLLVRLAGWPLPSRVPNADQVRVALGGDIGDQFWLKLFAIVVWLAWAQLMAAIVREVAALARGRLVRVRGADSWAQHVAGRLVGAIALAATVVGPAPGAQSRTLPQAVLEVARSQPEAEPSVTALALPTHVVVRGESLSSIAEAELGDESAWPGIWSANRGRTFGSRVFHDPNLILPGWELRLPHVAPAPPAPAPPAPVAPVLLPPVVITAPSSVPPTPAPTPAATAPAITTPAASKPAATALAPAPLLGGEVGAAQDLDRASSRDDAPAWARTSGVLGASLLATGIAATLAGRRRRALRAASAATAAPAPDAELAPLVTAVHATSDALHMARLELALRAMAGRLVSARSVARPLAVRAHADGRLEIVVDRDVTLEGPWVRSDAARCWVLPADVPLVALTDDSRGVAPPCPALVGLGADDDAEVYVDLEALPLLDVGSQVAGEELVPLIVTTLATTPLADELRVIVVGAELPGLSGRHSVQTVPDVASAVLEVETLTAGIASVTKGGPATFRLRASAGHEPWEPVVVVLSAAVERGDDLDRLVELAKGHRGVAVIGPELDVASWRLTAQGTSWELEPLGWTLRRYGLTEIEMGKIGDALAQANEPLITEVRTTSEPVCPPPRSWALMVRVLGPVDVVDRAGEPVAFERARSLELVVWLAQHGGNATRAGARSALWGLDISNASFSNVVSEARRAMARLVAPDGDDWLARTYAERLPLHPAVALDADVVAMHLDRARGMADEAAIEELRAALALVRGAPYAGASYPWADAEALPSTLTLLATTVAAELAERCLAAGDLGAVFAATARGLEVLPGHEELVALRMRAHAARGDLAAVRGEFASYAQAIASDVWAGGDVAPKLLALRKDLLAGPVPVAGS